MSPVHLGTMKLEGNGQRRFQQAAPVSAPDEKRIVEYAIVHTNCTAYFILSQGGGSDDHAIHQIMVDAALCDLPGKLQVSAVEQRQIIGKRYIARANFPLPVHNDGVHSYLIVLHQFATHRQQIELFHAACRPADAIAHQHVELHAFPPADIDKTGDIQGLEKRDHRHGAFINISKAYARVVSHTYFIIREQR